MDFLKKKKDKTLIHIIFFKNINKKACQFFLWPSKFFVFERIFYWHVINEFFITRKYVNILYIFGVPSKILLQLRCRPIYFSLYFFHTKSKSKLGSWKWWPKRKHIYNQEQVLLPWLNGWLTFLWFTKFCS